MARQYKAFISYSWADKAWAGWLHRALETYHTPKELIDQAGAHGPVPARLHPIFKDREEEAAGHGITAAIEAGMAASEFLIVICSPRSAKSEWVSKEVAWFKRNRDPTKILAMVVDGEPGASFIPGREAEECFPQTLLFRVDNQLSPTSEREDAPLAADARRDGDGRNGAKLKLAAAMLGVGLDDLVKRDERRRARRTRIIVTASLALAAIMTVLAGVAITSRNAAVAARAEAEFQRGEAEGLVEFMLTDLRKRLDAVGRLDVLDAVGGRALKYYSAQEAERLDPDALGRRARALLLVGEMQQMRGDLDGALAAYRNAARTTEEQLRRNPGNPQRLFDHSQSVFWVGYVALQTGKADQAERYFRQYQRYAQKLAAKQPNKPDWQFELAYAHSNLGTVLLSKGDWTSALTNFDKTLAIYNRLAKRKPIETQLATEMSDAMAWRADSLKIGGDLRAAMAQRRAQLSLLDDLLVREPRNMVAKFAQLTATRELGAIAHLDGDREAAARNLASALAIATDLRATDQDNAEYAIGEIQTRRALAAFHLRRCDAGAAAAQVDATVPLLQAIAEPDRGIRRQKQYIELELRTFDLHRQLLTNPQAASPPEFRRFIHDKTELLAKFVPDRDAPLLFARAEIALGDSEALVGDRRRALVAWQAARTHLSAYPSKSDTRFRSEMARLDLRGRLARGGLDRSAAADIRRRLFNCPVSSRF